MTSKSPAVAARSKLRLELAATEKQAETARKNAKLAKLSLRGAKEKYKEARRAAKKLRKAVKALKAELAAIVVRKSRRKSIAKKPATPLVETPGVSAPVIDPAESAAPLTEAPPTAAD